MKTLNELFSPLSTRRRYEVWFIRLKLRESNEAWWFRYLLMNPGRGGCAGDPRTLPVQVWATWFQPNAKPKTFIQGFSLDGLKLSGRGRSPFHFAIGDNAIEENSSRGHLRVDGHEITWELCYSSAFRVTLSNKGWIGFSRTPHSDAIFSGHISFDGMKFRGEPLGFGVQGHNCGYRHRNLWTWTHAFFLRANGPPSTFEALTYEMPLGLLFRKAVLWHDGQEYVFRNLKENNRDRNNLQWNLNGVSRDGSQVKAALDGRGPGIHLLPYVKTDCSGTFEVANNSLASATVHFARRDGVVEKLETAGGAVLEMVG